MTAHPTPTEFETRSNATYEALMWALSRPGLPRHLPAHGMTQIIDALIDRECAVHCADLVHSQVAEASGATQSTLDNADHVFIENLTNAELLKQLRCGSDLYPEDGATLICGGRMGGGQRLRLTGPGCNGPVEIEIAGLPEGFWQTRAQVMRYPMGFEVFLVDGDKILGIPRSTLVEVL